MDKQFINKIINKNFDSVGEDELKAIIKNDHIFKLSKKDKKTLERIVENIPSSKKGEIGEVLREVLPNSFVILSHLDEHSLNADGLEINYRRSLIENLNKMNILQLCIFIDKVLMISDDNEIRFFRKEDYALHAINSVVSKSFGLTLVFEIFKPGKYKTFKYIDYERIDRDAMIATINEQAVRYRYILEIISAIVLETDEEKLFGTKINKNIRDQTAPYIKIIRKERAAVKKSGTKTVKTWSYTINNITDITLDDDDEFF